jgi:energy-coupling factor transporter ATP-binding protein EcfA2
MTTLKEFQVSGLAGRRDPVSFSLDRHINIFFGLNGCGKTSLLKILHSALSDEHGALVNVPFRRASVKFYAATDDANYERTIARQDAEESLARKELELQVWAEQRSPAARNAEMSALAAARARQFPRWTTSPPSDSAFRHRYLPTSRLVGDFSPSATAGAYIERSGLSEYDLDSLFAQHIQRIWRSYTNSVLTDVRRVQTAGIADILRSVLFPPKKVSKKSPLEVQQAYERASQFLARQAPRRRNPDISEFEDRYNNDPQLRSVVQDIDEIERQIERAEEPRQRLIELINSFVSEGKEITFAYNEVRASNYGEVVPLSGLSSGEKQLVMLLIEVILTGENPILIDEPELSMHIDWQMKLVHAMRIINPDAQIIMATHAPEIMENVDDRYIFAL